jgi:hypothetical protein
MTKQRKGIWPWSAGLTGRERAVRGLLLAGVAILALYVVLFVAVSLDTGTAKADPTARASGARHTECARLGNSQGVNGGILGLNLRVKFADMFITEGYCIRTGGGRANKIVTYEAPQAWSTVTTEASIAGWSSLGVVGGTGPKLYGLRTGLVTKRLYQFQNCLLKFLPLCKKSDVMKVKLVCYAGGYGDQYCWYGWPQLGRRGCVGAGCYD